MTREEALKKVSFSFYDEECEPIYEDRDLVNDIYDYFENEIKSRDKTIEFMNKEMIRLRQEIQHYDSCIEPTGGQ